MTIDQRLRQSEFHAELANLVLEQIFERLNQFETEFLGQPADIVVRFDVGSGSIHSAAALDDIRIEGSLGQEMSALNVASLVFEHVDEYMADTPTFLLRIADTF